MKISTQIVCIILAAQMHFKSPPILLLSPARSEPNVAVLHDKMKLFSHPSNPLEDRNWVYIKKAIDDA